MSKVKSLTDRLSNKFKSAFHLGSSSGPDTTDRRSAAQRAFAAIDTNGDGFIDRAELAAWLLDECFIDNPIHGLHSNNVSSIEELTSKTFTRLSRSHSPHDTRISQSDFYDSLSNKKSAEVEEMFRSCLSVSRDRKERAIRKVFDAIDVNGTGDLDFDSVNVWLKYDVAYMASIGIDTPLSLENNRQSLFDELDRDRDGCLTFDDINAYLQSWNVRDIRVRTASMRQDAETRKMKRMAELLAASMAAKLGLDGNENDSCAGANTGRASVSNNDNSLRVSNNSRPRSVSDLKSMVPPSFTNSPVRRPLKAPNGKSQISRQIDELVLQSLALAAENSEINARRRKLNSVNEKLDRQLVSCERERMKLIVKITELDNESGGGHSHGGGSTHGSNITGTNADSDTVNSNIASKQSIIVNLHSRCSQLESQRQSLTQRVTLIESRLSSTGTAIPAADEFIAQTKSTHQRVERALDTVEMTPSNPAIETEKSKVTAKLEELDQQVEQVKLQRESLESDRESLSGQLDELWKELNEVNARLVECEHQISHEQSLLQSLELERDRQSHSHSQPQSQLQSVTSHLSPLIANATVADLPRLRDTLATINADRESMAAQLREMEHQHSALTRRHVEISTALTNINQQISILFDGQIHERRNSFGEFSLGVGSNDGIVTSRHEVDSHTSVPVPCVASVECEMDGRKTTGLLNVSNFILMYESRIAGYVGRALPASAGIEQQSPPSASVASSRRQSILAAPASDFGLESCRFCVEMSDVQSVRFIHANDDDGHDEEGYDEEGVASIEHAIKEPAIATLLIELKAGFKNRFLTSDTEESHTAQTQSPEAVTTPPLGPQRPSSALLPSHSSLRSRTVACFGDYDSLRRIDKSLRLSLQLYESKINHAAFRRRAASVQIPSHNSLTMEERINEMRKQQPAAAGGNALMTPTVNGVEGGGVVGLEGAECEITIVGGVSELISPNNLKRLLSLTRSIAGSSPWRLAYSTIQHGSSFPFFFNLLAGVSDSLILISTHSEAGSGSVIGGFCAAPWENHIHTLNSSFYGNNDCFVFTVDPNNDGADRLEDSANPSKPKLAHSSTEPISPSSASSQSSDSLLLPSTAASSIVVDTMLKATHAVEAASAAGLAVAPAVRRASIDTTAASASSAHSTPSKAEASIVAVAHRPSTIRVFRASDRDSRFMFSSSDSIGMGGADTSDAANTGEFGAWRLDREFSSGRSNASPTFNSPPLSINLKGGFPCHGLEVWVPIVSRPVSPPTIAVQGSGFAIAITPPETTSPTTNKTTTTTVHVA